MRNAVEFLQRTYRFLAARGTAIGLLVIAVALVLTVYAFKRSEEYRQATETIMSQTFEVQDRASQVRERLANAIADIKVVRATGKDEVGLEKELRLLKTNLITLRNLDYSPRFLQEHDMAALDRSIAVVDEILASARGNDPITSYGAAMSRLEAMQEDVWSVAGSSTAHSQTLSETAWISSSAARNAALFAVAALLVLVMLAMFVHAATLSKRQDQRSRSFTSLFAHQTRTRIAALVLFFKAIDLNTLPDPELVSAAERAAKELDSINNSILLMSGTTRPTSDKESLASVLVALQIEHGHAVSINDVSEAEEILVPTPHLRLILSELAQNAKHAIAARVGSADEPRIIVSHRIQRQWFFWRQLVIEVADNGIGMNRAARRKATTPFFSTRAGRHVGLGLTGCLQLVQTLKGHLRIISKPGVGTTIRIRVPVGKAQPAAVVTRQTA
ncbi:HAMP domain-containing histidine kinase [Mycobacterium sp. KBS0706]|uniref:sensor histidine kinase n=1 Tax=Mycobacterium sp. KBS0706 TaxID=2578109 RepID=UPI00110F831A|nr:HAMP domain-containing sensor histidine kinase [Mycobacterium sp. KBS0706]TSD87013.1 HAMP domain-containing histidine kinase [Mycobacterium sp. KBS0706]